MELNELYENLCVRDKKSPYYDPEYADEIPRKGCFCDNCFYGRDKLALEIIRLQESLEEYKDAAKYAADVIGSHFISAESRKEYHSLGCDIAITHLKYLCGMQLTDHDTALLERHLPLHYKLGRNCGC